MLKNIVLNQKACLVKVEVLKVTQVKKALRFSNRAICMDRVNSPRLSSKFGRKQLKKVSNTLRKDAM